jgi:hypothetical protein
MKEIDSDVINRIRTKASLSMVRALIAGQGKGKASHSCDLLHRLSHLKLCGIRIIKEITIHR